MKWFGPMMHLIFAPRHDAVGVELAAMLDKRTAAVAEIGAARANLERIAADRGAALDDVAGARR